MCTVMSDQTQAAPYSGLTPEVILGAIESVSLAATGSLLALNSYENRVYQVQLDDGQFVVAKFYRPGRWTNAAILEEHAFAMELAAQEIPVVAPMVFNDQSLHEYAGYRFCVYPRHGGRWPELDREENLEQLGRFIGRIHMVGRAKRFEHRLKLTVASYGQASLDYLLKANFVPQELMFNYQQAAQSLLDYIAMQFEAILPQTLRIYGDCHPGNILATPQGFHFVDLDDCCSGPAVQDLWMLLSGEAHEMTQQMRIILRGYQTFTEFDYSELALIESLRGLRLLHYSAWLARRWEDPAFPQHFPWFNTPRYWEDQLNTFREQLERCHAPSLDLKAFG